MLNKKFMLMAIFIISLLAVSAVSANDLEANDEIAINEDSADYIGISGSESIDNGLIDSFGDESINKESINILYGSDEEKDNLKVKTESNLSQSFSVSGDSFEDIQKAINSAKSGDTISLSGNYLSVGKKIKINKTLNIEGNGATLDANFSSKVFEITGNNVVVNNITFINGKDVSSGAIDWWTGTYDGPKDSNGLVKNCRFINCYGEYLAGAIYFFDNRLTMQNCYFENNYASKGGAVVLSGANCVVDNCSFYNSFADEGGSIYISGDNAKITSSRFENSKNAAIYATADCQIKDSEFINNRRNREQCDILTEIKYDDYGMPEFSPEVSTSNCKFSYDIKSFDEIRELINSGESKIELSGHYLYDGEPIYVDRPIAIVGIGKTVIDGDFGGPILYIEANNVNISNLEISNGKNNENFESDTDPLSVIFISGNNAFFENVSFINNIGLVSPIAVTGNNYTFKDCDFTNNKVIIVPEDPNSSGGLKTFYDKWGKGETLKVYYNDYLSRVYMLEYLEYDYVTELTSTTAVFTYMDSAGSLLLLGDNGTLYNCDFSNNSGYKDYDLIGNNIKVIVPYSLSSPDISMYFGASKKFTTTLTKSGSAIANAYVNISLNNRTYSVKTDNKGQASLALNLSSGTYNVKSEYEGVSTYSTITVKPTLIVSNIAGTYLNSKVNATFLNSSGKALANTKVSFKVGSKTYNATTNANGVATASVDLGVGTYNVTAINPASNEQKNFRLTISKAKSSLAVSSSSSNNVLTLTATVSPSVSSGNVVFNLNNKNYTAKISSGKAVQNVTGLNTGNYTVKASYNGDSNFNSSSTTVKVAFKKVIVTKIIYNDMYTGPVPKDAGRIGNYFCVKLVDDKNNPLGGLPMEIGFNGRIYNKTTDSNGDARLQINLGYEGAYTFAIGFLGDDERGAAFEVAKIKVSKSYPKPNKANETSSGYELNTSQSKTKIKTSIDYNNMNTKSVIKVEGRAGDDFVVTLLDNNKKPLANMPVKIGFNGVIYNKTTDSAGKAQLKINLLYPNTYTFAICYLGDSKYQASFVVAKIKVSKQTPKLSSSSKTFKSSAKTKSLSATLVSMRGKAISGQKLKFTVNGKTYTGKTNAKGVATVNISLNKKGTYSCTVKFAGMTGVSSKSTKISVKIT